MDSNIILTESGKVLELQISSENKPYETSRIPELIALAEKGVKEIIKLQYEALKQK